jgi:tetratricopeptide (TPR) repeat protein
MQQGALHDAAALADAVLAETPDDASTLYLRGVIASRLRQYPQAIAAFRRAIALRPDDALAALGLGNACARAGDLDAAADAYRAVIGHRPDWADAHFNLGIMRKRQGRRAEAARALQAAWRRNPMFFDAAKECVATVAECVRRGELLASPPAAPVDRCTESFTIVVCSIDDAKHHRVASLYRRLFAGAAHELVVVRNARSLASAYNEAVACSTADIVLLSHDDIDILVDDFAPRLASALRRFEGVGVVGSTVMAGPAVGWAGHPNLRGWITHRDPTNAAWRVDVLDPRGTASDIAVLDGVLIAARREVLRAVPFDDVTFDGFHLYDLDWSYRASKAGYRLGVVGDLMLVHESRGRYETAWERYADRFCLKHAIYRTPSPPSSFFGATLEKAEEVRAFFRVLASLND